MDLEFLDASLVCVRLEKRRAKMIEYLHTVIDAEDWHGVMDVAADIRELEAELAVWKKFVKSGDILS